MATLELSFAPLEFREFLVRQAFSADPLPLCKRGCVFRTCPVAQFLNATMGRQWIVGWDGACMDGLILHFAPWVIDYIQAFDAIRRNGRPVVWSDALHVLDTMPN